MTQLNFHNEQLKTFSHATLPIIQKLVVVYKVWHEFLPHIQKTSRFNLGSKIDSLFVEIIELSVMASHLNRSQKFPYIQKEF